jgi:hypothetical protein
VKTFRNNDMVEVQTWDPSNIVQCDNNLGPFRSVFSPRASYQHPSLNKYVKCDNKVSIHVTYQNVHKKSKTIDSIYENKKCHIR